MYCGKCGFKVSPNFAFCAKCGAKISKFNFVDNSNTINTSNKNIKDDDIFNSNKLNKGVVPVEEVVIEVPEKEKTITSVSSNSVIYGVIASTMVISIFLITFISLAIK